MFWVCNISFIYIYISFLDIFGTKQPVQLKLYALVHVFFPARLKKSGITVSIFRSG